MLRGGAAGRWGKIRGHVCVGRAALVRGSCPRPSPPRSPYCRAAASEEEEEEEGLPRPWAQPGCSSFQRYTRTVKGHSRLVFKVYDFFWLAFRITNVNAPEPDVPRLSRRPSRAASFGALIEARKAAKWLAQAASPCSAHQSPAPPTWGAARHAAGTGSTARPAPRPWIPGGFVPSTLR